MPQMCSACLQFAQCSPCPCKHGWQGREQAVAVLRAISRATAFGAPSRLRQHRGWRATSVANANRPCAQSTPAHVLGVGFCMRVGKPNRSPGRGGWLHRGAGGFRACHRGTHPIQGGRANRMVCWSSICASPQAPRCGRPPRWPRAVVSGARPAVLRSRHASVQPAMRHTDVAACGACSTSFPTRQRAHHTLSPAAGANLHPVPCRRAVSATRGR